MSKLMKPKECKMHGYLFDTEIQKWCNGIIDEIW